MTSRTHNVAAVGAIALFWAISTTPMAWATPAANPKPDTPNTSSWISSTSVEQCSTLDFEAHGFPKGQTLNIALDDDQEADKQPIDDTGSASGTIEIPCDFPTGTHRLHFTSAVSVVFFAVPLRFCDAPRLPVFEPAFGSVLLLVRPVPLARWALSRLGVALGLLAASLVAAGFAVTSKLGL